MDLFKPCTFANRTWAAAWLLCLGAPLAMAQMATGSVQTPVQAPIPGSVQVPLHSTLQMPAMAVTQGPVPAPVPVQLSPHAPGKSVSGRVSAPASESASAAPSSAATPSSLASASTSPAEPLTEVPSAPATATGPAPDSVAAESSSASDGPDVLAQLDPRNQPLVGVGALLALMLVVAVLVYRRNRRADARALSTSPSVDEEPGAAADALPPTRGLQPEIMALDLELDATLSPLEPIKSPEPLTPESAAPAPTTAAPSAEDLSLSKLEWAEKLLAAGENELARVLLTSVATTLKSQLQQPSSPDQGSRP